MRTLVFTVLFFVSGMLLGPGLGSLFAQTSFDAMYERIADDVAAGNPLVVVAHFGMWHVRADNPERNLNWGVFYGHATMMKRAARDKHIKKNYVHHKFEKVFESSQESDPIRTLIFRARVKPNASWKEAGVQKPFDLYYVMKAYTGQETAAIDVTKIMRQQKGEKIATDDGGLIDTSQAQVVGYFGHNFFYDYDNFDYAGLRSVKGTIEKPTGVFAVGCKTARVPGFDAWYEENSVPVLFSRSLMASEGYSSLALLDGLARKLDGKKMVEHADATYRYFQKLGKPDRRVGRPFVSVEHRFEP